MPRADEVVIGVEACGVCRTDLQLCEGDLEFRKRPAVPGHQVVGVIESKAHRVSNVNGWPTSDRCHSDASDSGPAAREGRSALSCMRP